MLFLRSKVYSVYVETDIIRLGGCSFVGVAIGKRIASPTYRSRMCLQIGRGGVGRRSYGGGRGEKEVFSLHNLKVKRM